MSQGRDTSPHRRRVVVGLSGATGVDYGIALLAALRARDVETHLVVAGVAAAALGDRHEAALRLADRTYAEDNQAARISSGSFLTCGMVVAPCDPHSLAAIALGLATNLVYRAADVTLKEGRPLVLGLSEPADSPIDRANLARALEVPGLSAAPLEGPAEKAVGALLDQLGIEQDLLAG